MGDLVITDANGRRIAWDSNGDGITPQADEAVTNFGELIEALRTAEDLAEEEGGLISPQTPRTGSYQGTVYETGELPPENETLYVQLGEGDSLWTVAEDLSIIEDQGPQGWWQLVKDNPQFDNPDVIPTGVPVAVDVGLLSPETTAALQEAGAINPDGTVPGSVSPEDVAATYSSQAGQASAHGADLTPAADNLKESLQLMSPQAKQETLETIIENDGLQPDAKEKAVITYLNTIDPVNGETDSILAISVVSSYIESLDPAERAEAANNLITQTTISQRNPADNGVDQSSPYENIIRAGYRDATGEDLE